MDKRINTQIEIAFQNLPDLDGTIHGVRKIRQGKQGSRSSLFFSIKNDAFIPVESRLERLYCYTLEKNPSVIKYRSQAIAVPYGKHYLYPDFLTLHTNQSVCIREIKSACFADSEKNLTKGQYLQSVFKKEGVDFRVVTDKDLIDGHEKENLIMTYDRGGKLQISDFSKELLKKICCDITVKTPLKTVRFELTKQGLPPQYLEAAIFYGFLKHDTAQPINSNTFVWG